ncbi:MAG TPA: hypothetical protein VFK73_05255, partial [Paludibacter sp.]|nr:hypothetical protein [Paludibacter sp.]
IYSWIKSFCLQVHFVHIMKFLQLKDYLSIRLIIQQGHNPLNYGCCNKRANNSSLKAIDKIISTTYPFKSLFDSASFSISDA